MIIEQTRLTIRLMQLSRRWKTDQDLAKALIDSIRAAKLLAGTIKHP